MVMFGGGVRDHSYYPPLTWDESYLFTPLPNISVHNFLFISYSFELGLPLISDSTCIFHFYL